MRKLRTLIANVAFLAGVGGAAALIGLPVAACAGLPAPLAPVLGLALLALADSAC